MRRGESPNVFNRELIFSLFFIKTTGQRKQRPTYYRTKVITFVKKENNASIIK